MRAPSYTIKANRIEGDDITHQRSPSWCVAFVRYAEPAAGYALADTKNTNGIKKIMYIENDCIAVTVNNPKSSFGKTCSMTLKAGEVYYINAVSPGDWVFVWINNYQDDIDRVINGLIGLSSYTGGTLNNWDSGLKFAGRVLEVHTADTVAENGVRTVVQTVTAQSFLEFSTSVYYTDTARNFFTMSLDPNAAKGNPQLSLPLLAQNGLDAALGGLSGKFVDFFSSDGSFYSYPPPERAIAFYLVIALGIQKDKFLEPLFDRAGYKVEGVISDAIDVPSDVARILGKPSATKLWQLMNIYLGLQQYKKGSGAAWTQFAPVTNDLSVNKNPVFFLSKIPLKGWIPFFPTPWDNKSLWDILNEYLNPVVNEMYTVLRVDKYNRIRPSLMVREQPFGTTMYDVMHTKPIIQVVPKGKTHEEILKKFNEDRDKAYDQAQAQAKQVKVPFRADKKKVPRAMYDTLPRWVIDESMIRSVNLYTSEQNRVNFVQVWGQNQYLSIAPPSAANSTQDNSVETAKNLQMLAGNMVEDDADIDRNGLRANIAETPFDYPVPYMSFTDIWSKMRADWLFNGHLKAMGTVTLSGVAEPICEGDNAELRGLVFHIERVTHKAAIVNGAKTFITELALSNGITAWSLNNDKLPRYMVHLPHDANEYKDIPGVTDIQYTHHTNRDQDGELTGSKPEDKP